jgi:hypothetical protein
MSHPDLDRKISSSLSLRFQDTPGVDVEQVRLLNSFLRNGRTPGDRRVVVRLRAGSSDAFLDNFMRYAGRPEPLSKRIVHPVALKVTQ